MYGYRESLRLWTQHPRLNQHGSIPMNKILILGGDGFCGWPTALHLSGLGTT
jgi:hypothetical protein